MNYSQQSISSNTETADKNLIDIFIQIISIKNELLTPYIGYTEQNPHLLISKFFNKDHLTSHPAESTNITTNFLLYQIFQQMSNTDTKYDQFTGTFKTKIALCVSKAMMFLHDNNTIHENLQPMTIKILGNLHIPQLFDYGLNEFRGNPLKVNKNRCLAPELREITDYNKETDVFAFGLLLYELFIEIR